MGKDLLPASPCCEGACSSPLTLPWTLLCRLGLAYAGSNREDVLTLLLPVMGDSKSSMEVGSETGFTWGSCFPTRSLAALGNTGAVLQLVWALRARLHVPPPCCARRAPGSQFSSSELLPRWDCSRCGRVGSRQVFQEPKFSHKVGTKGTHALLVWAAVRLCRPGPELWVSSLCAVLMYNVSFTRWLV